VTIIALPVLNLTTRLVNVYLTLTLRFTGVSGGISTTPPTTPWQGVLFFVFALKAFIFILSSSFAEAQEDFYLRHKPLLFFFVYFICFSLNKNKQNVGDQ
jgi:hypothetical protein